jgi:hypothetical protein
MKLCHNLIFVSCGLYWHVREVLLMLTYLKRWAGIRLCGLVARVPGYRYGGPGSIPGTTRFWEVVGLERDPPSLLSTTEEILSRKSSGFGLENREFGRGDPSGSPRYILYSQTLALTTPSSGGFLSRYSSFAWVVSGQFSSRTCRNTQKLRHQDARS